MVKVWPSLIIPRVIEKESSWQLGKLRVLHGWAFILCSMVKVDTLLLIGLLVGEEPGLTKHTSPDTASEHLNSEAPDW